MSPQAALESEVFRFYAALAVVLLVAGGGVIAFLGLALKRDVGHAKKAYRGWLVMIPLVLGSLFLGRVAAILFFMLLAVLALKEFARATRLDRDWGMTGVVYLGLASVAIVLLVSDPREGVPGWYGLFMALPAYVVAAILVIPIVRNRAEGQLRLMALSVIGFLYIGWMFGHLAFLANARHAYGYLLFLILAVELNDVAAYTFGKLLGRHKLRSNISPGKTWEGAVGALCVSMALPWALRFSLPQFGPIELVLTGLIVGIAGQLGDLSMSVIKRDLGVKDMGTLIRGHGGVLDRIDSLIYVAPLFFHMVRFFHDLH